MLVISRKPNQRTYITVPPSDKPTVVEVMVVQTESMKTRLGFTAPREVQIVRDDAVNRPFKIAG